MSNKATLTMSVYDFGRVQGLLEAAKELTYESGPKELIDRVMKALDEALQPMD